MKLDIIKQFSTRSDRVKGIDLHPTEPWVLTTLYNGKIEIWSYETNQIIKSIQVTDVPIRTGKFIARKNWIIVGADDFQIRVYNYNTSEKIIQFEAHPDYIRALAVHPSKPFVLTSSDDMSIKLWNWEKNWKCEQVFEGHQHYVMSVNFNPKDPNTFASACLDRTIKIWSLGSSKCNLTLVAHAVKGVNFVDYYSQADKPYLITTSDDKTIKIWDYQTKSLVASLEGHLTNVSFAVFHPELPLIISGSEDGTVKVWNSNTYKLEKSLNYGYERVWCASYMKNTNLIAVGCDSGHFVMKLGNEEPIYSMDPMGKIIFGKHSEIYQSVIKSNSGDEIKDGEYLPLQQKELGNTEVFPQSLKHSPNGRFVAVTGDGEYIIYTALAWRNKSYGNCLDFVWAQDSNSNLFAIRESPLSIKIYKDFKEKTSNQIYLVYQVDKIFGGALIGVKSEGFICFYDWESGELVRRVDVDVQDVVWSDSGELITIISNEGAYILKYDSAIFNAALQESTNHAEEGVEEAFEVLYDFNDSILSGKWVGDVFVYSSTNNRLNYFVGGETLNIAHFDKKFFILGYLPKDNKIYVIDKDLNVSSYYLSLNVLEFQTLVLRGDLSELGEEPSKITKDELNDHLNGLISSLSSSDLNKISRFLEKQNYLQLALELTNDNETKFELSISTKKFYDAYEIAKLEKNESKWKKLGDLALSNWKIKLAIECFEEAKDYASLLLLHTSTNNTKELHKLAENAIKSGKYNIAFNALWTSGDLDKSIQVLIDSNKIPDAALMSLTYGVDSLRIKEVVELWKVDLISKNKKDIAERLTEPISNPEIFSQNEIDLIDITETSEVVVTADIEPVSTTLDERIVEDNEEEEVETEETEEES